MNEQKPIVSQAADDLTKTRHDAVESKQTGDIQLDETPAKLTEEDVRTTGVDEVGLLTENRSPNKPPTGG
jgi:hypothetical protein